MKRDDQHPQSISLAEGDLAEPQLSPAESNALHDWKIPEPPADFAEKVVAAYRASAACAQQTAATKRPGYLRKNAGWILPVSAVALGMVFLLARSKREPASFHYVLPKAERQSLAIGERAIVVAEPNTAVSWQLDGNQVSVSQPVGEAFYRVNPGGAFAVDTPAGEVLVKGTCFRVEVKMSDWKKIGFGAVAGILVTVTVYEGKVLFAEKKPKAGSSPVAIAAGQSLQANADGAGKVVEAMRSAGSLPLGSDSVSDQDASSLTPEQLIARDRVQRQEIAALRQKVQVMSQEMAEGGPDAPEADGSPWFDPSPATLQKFAKECRVRFDLPPMVMRAEPFTIGPRNAEEWGLTAPEVTVLNQTFAELHSKYVAQIRAMYIELTGNQDAADDLSPEAMANELKDKSGEEENGRIMKQIAQERAGLAKPPTDLASLSILDRYYRMMATLGNDAERAIASKIGPDRAKKIRGKGWGHRSEYAGCPTQPEEK